MKVVCYTRVSTGEQAESGLSLDNQEVKTRGLAALHDWEVVEAITDGASAKSLDRAGCSKTSSSWCERGR